MLKANVAELLTAGVQIVFAQFISAKEINGGIEMASNSTHPAKGAVFFFPDSMNAPIREALGLPLTQEQIDAQMKAAEPVATATEQPAATEVTP